MHRIVLCSTSVSGRKKQPGRAGGAHAGATRSPVSRFPGLEREVARHCPPGLQCGPSGSQHGAIVLCLLGHVTTLYVPVTADFHILPSWRNQCLWATPGLRCWPVPALEAPLLLGSGPFLSLHGQQHLLLDLSLPLVRTLVMTLGPPTSSGITSRLKTCNSIASAELLSLSLAVYLLALGVRTRMSWGMLFSPHG